MVTYGIVRSPEVSPTYTVAQGEPPMYKTSSVRITLSVRIVESLLISSVYGH